MTTLRRTKLVIAGIVFALLAIGCSSGGNKQKFAYVEKPVEQLYAQATRAMDKKRYEEAVAFFEEVERQHPYSTWARRAMLMKAFAYYQGNDYEESIASVDQFIALHPGNKDAPYAYYLRAMNFYERVRDVGRDQEYTNNTVQAFNDLIRRYPETEYARDARLKLDLAFDQLAGKEMYVGRYYLSAGKHIAAINRFKRVVSNYQRTSHTPEALHRLVEANMEIGLVEEARSAAAVLGHNFPGSEWYADTYKLMKRYGVLQPGTKPVSTKRKKKKEKERSLEELRTYSPPASAIDLIERDEGSIDQSQSGGGR